MAQKNRKQKAQKAAKKTSITSFVSEARDELKKVSWPSRETTVRYTGIVIVSSLALGFIIGGIDYLFVTILETII